MNQTLQRIIDVVIIVGLRVLTCVAILIIGWVIAKALGGVVDRLLARVGLNRLSERTGLRRWTGKYTASSLIGKLLYYILLLFTFQIAFSVFGPNPISDLIDTVIAWLPRLIVACVIVVVAVAIANAVFDVITNALSQFSYGRALGRVAQVIIMVLGAIAALNQIGIATTVTMPVLITILATIAGILIVGVGGGLVQPMRHRWERMLNSAETEGAKLATHLRTRPDTMPVQPDGTGDVLVPETMGDATRETARDSAPDVKDTRGDGITQPPYAGGDPARDLKQPSTQNVTETLHEEVRPGGERPNG